MYWGDKWGKVRPFQLEKLGKKRETKRPTHTKKNRTEPRRETKKGKNVSPHRQKQPPAPRKKSQFATGHGSGIYMYNPNTIDISKKLLPLLMGYEIEMINRLRIGFAIGWSYYAVDPKYDYSELNIYLGLISISIKIF